MSDNSRFDFNIDNHDPNTESCFSFKSKFLDEYTVETKLEFYGSIYNIVTTVVALYNDNEQARDVLSAMMAGLTINRINQSMIEAEGMMESEIPPINGEEKKDGKSETKNGESEAEGDVLSA